MPTNAFPKRGLGDYSRGSIRALEFAQTLQGVVLDSLRDQFAAASGLDIRDEVKYGDFIRALTEAEESGQRDAFEAHLAAQLGAAWTNFQAQQAAAAAPAPEGE